MSCVSLDLFPSDSKQIPLQNNQSLSSEQKITPKRILIADGSRKIAQQIKWVLKDSFSNYDLTFVHSKNKSEMLETLQSENSFDLVIFDWSLDEVSALGTIQYFDTVAPTMPFIVFSEKIHNFALTQGQSNIKSWLLKPTRPQRLADIVEIVLDL